MAVPRERDRSVLWRAADLPGVALLRAQFVEHAFAPHAHDEWMVGVIEAGVKRFAYRGAQHHALPGEVSLVNPGEVHTGRRVAGEVLRYRAFYFEPEYLAAVFGSSTVSFRVSVTRDSVVAQALSEAHAALEVGATPLEGEEKLVGAVRLLFGRHGTAQTGTVRPGREHRAVGEARAYLDAHFRERVTLTGLAGVVGLTGGHLTRVFRGEVGLSPHEYQTQLRVREAMRLRRSGLPLAQIALEVGFVDQAHLARQFKRLSGVTLTHYLPW